MSANSAATVLLFLACSSLVFAQSDSPFPRKTCVLFTRSEYGDRVRAPISWQRQPQCRLGNGLLLSGSNHGVVAQLQNGGAEPFPPAKLLPWNEVTVIARQSDDAVWIGTTRGAVRYSRSTGTIEYFSGRRWLADDRVTGIGFEPGGSFVWIETPGGYSRIDFTPITLAGKAAYFEERVRARHVRHGFTADSELRTPGDPASSFAISTDNDGLWTAMYVAAECFRFKVTGAADAREYARQGLEALIRLEAVTGIPGFPARSIIRLGVDEQPRDGEWHTTPDGLWRWKGDTSSDEIVGHYFAYAVYFDLVADEAEKTRIRQVVERITSHIIDHGYHLVDLDGKATRWGWWAPEEIWTDPDETGLRALHILSHLRVASHITGNERYNEAYRDLVSRHRYAFLTRNQKVNIPGHVNHSDDELAFLSYYPLLLYETDPALRKVYMESLERAWQCERAEANPLWNYIYAAGTGSGDYDGAPSAETLRRIPMDLICWTVANSHRLDVVTDPVQDRFSRRQSALVLPADERPVMKWNGNPYMLDGGNGGRSEDDGAFFLLPYWMARYHNYF
jgi:hypothetical protein